MNWGLPFLFHPDEMNIAVAALRLAQTGSPDFFAYGQLPLFFVTFLGFAKTLPGAAMGLRLLSTLCFFLTAYFLYRYLKPGRIAFIAALLFLITPLYMQGARFGTTESLLLLLFVLLMNFGGSPLSGLLFGTAVATKISSAVFLVVPLWYFIRVKEKFRYGVFFILASLSAYTLTSPYNIREFDKFIASMRYESSVATGALNVFYTHQFHDLFPLSILWTFVFALGVPLLMLALLGLQTAWRKKRELFLWWAVVSIPTLFLYAQWIRFYYVSSVFVVLFAAFGATRYRKTGIVLIALQCIFTGIFLYNILQKDTRIAATEWILSHVPVHSVIYTEAANVYDLPLNNSERYRLRSNFLYTTPADTVPEGYVVIPSRRVFANYTCAFRPPFLRFGIVCSVREKERPDLTRYYKLNTCTLVHTESRLLPFEEFAEETWTVFDRPVIRIYKCPGVR